LASPIRQDFEFGGLLTSVAENRVPINRAWSMSNCLFERGIIEARPGYTLFGQRTDAHALDVGYGLAYGKYSNDEVQTLTMGGTPTGGTFTLTWNAQTTAALAYNSTAAQIQAALENLSNVLIGDVLVEGGPFVNATVRVTFKGQYANTDVAAITANSAGLTGGSSPAVTIAETVKGGTAEEYLVILKKNGDTDATLYSVDASTGVFTSVATGLEASDWYMVQYGNKIYGVNATQGMFVKTIGTSTGATTAFTRPAAPVLAPTSTISGTTPTNVSNTGLTAGTYVGWGSNPTSVVLSSGTIVLTLTANLAANSEVSFNYEWAADKDYTRGDVWFVSISSNKQLNINGEAHQGTSVQFIDNAAATYNPPIYGDVRLGGVYSTGALGRAFHWQGESRTGRAITRKIKFTFRPDVALVTGDTISVYPRYGSTWPNDTKPVNVDNVPSSRTIEYAYSYQDAANGLESDLSPVLTTAVIPPANNRWGGYAVLSGVVSGSLTGTDKLYFYRREKSTGKMRRLPNLDGTVGVANSGSPSFSDPYLESELAAFSEFGEGQVGLASSQIAGVAVQIATWKQTLTVAARRQAFISWIGQPARFAPSADDFGVVAADEEDADRGRTDYVSDNRAEEIMGLAGQDSLYAATTLSSYAMVGDSPAEAALFRRLPGSRGAVGGRSTWPYGGGFEVASQDGLWYYSVGRGFSGDDNGALLQREETADVRKTWETLAPSSSTVVVEHNDEIWVWDGTAYMLNTRSRKWTAGTFADSVKAAVSNRVRGLKFINDKGQLFTISTAYTTDNGTAIAWHYETGWLESTRAHIKGVRCYGSGTPVIKTYVDDGLASVTSPVSNTKVADKVAVDNYSVSPGTRYKLRLEGATASDTVESLAMLVEKAPEGQST
jgi:hypothetical protein